MIENCAAGMSESKEENVLLLTAIGNPNVDITVIVDDIEFFVQHNIPQDGQIPVSAEFMATLERDFKRQNYKTMLFPGGCSQNTLRVFQWLMDSKFQSSMIGSVGNDKEAHFLKSQLGKDGVKPCYTVIDDCRTSSVFLFVRENFRSAVYLRNGGRAALKYSTSHLFDHADALRSIENSKIVLTEGFFTEHSAETALKVLDICVGNEIVTSFNISGECVVEQHFEKAVLPFVQRCNLVVGNLEEFNSLCVKLGVPNEQRRKAAIDVHKIMMSHVLSTEYRIKLLERYQKILIVTNGREDVLCVTNSDGLITYPIPTLECNQIKDTTGAGDSFLAGFLYALLKEQTILKCLEVACRVAGEIIQQYGTALPQKKINFLNNR